MQINLKQPEIEVALKNYIAEQGISLYGKAVGVTFTAGRKESGISAEVTIEDLDIPGFGADDEVGPASAPVHQEAKVLSLTPAPAIAAEVVEATAPAATVEVVAEAPAQEDGATKSPSLFG